VVGLALRGGGMALHYCSPPARLQAGCLFGSPGMCLRRRLLPLLGIVSTVPVQSVPQTILSTSSPAFAVASPRPPAPRQVANDTAWHLVGITTHPEGGKGFHLYIDGVSVAEVHNETQYVGE